MQITPGPYVFKSDFSVTVEAVRSDQAVDTAARFCQPGCKGQSPAGGT